MFKIEVIPSSFDYRLAESIGWANAQFELFFANDKETTPSHMHWYMTIDDARLKYKDVKHLFDLNTIKTMSFEDNAPYCDELK